MSVQDDLPSEDELDALMQQLDREQIEREERALARWHELIEAVRYARYKQRFDPSYPQHRIGRFELVTCRAHGGFGVIFEGRDPQLGRRVAIKLCLADRDADRAALLKEAQLMSQLSHPNVVTVLEVGSFEGEVFFVMEYLGGGTASKLIGCEPAASWEQILRVYRGAAAGLAAAHEHEPSIVHGDFKPGNILLDDDDWPRVADFGLAHRSQSPGAQVGGTRLYSAPETLREGRVDQRSDQWSFFVSLWWTLHGLPPFFGEGEDGLLAEMEAGPRAWVPGVPAKLQAFMLRGLSVEPEQRFPAMRVVIAELDALLREFEHEGAVTEPRSGDSAVALELGRSVGGRERGRRARWARRVIRRATLAGAAAGVLAGVMSRGLMTPPQFDRLEDEDMSEIEPRKSVTACNIEKVSIVEIGSSLESVCRDIRQGQVVTAVERWKGVRARRAPREGDPNYDGKLLRLVTETKVVRDTLEAVSEIHADADEYISAVEAWCDDDYDELAGTSH